MATQRLEDIKVATEKLENDVAAEKDGVVADLPAQRVRRYEKTIKELRNKLSNATLGVVPTEEQKEEHKALEVRVLKVVDELILLQEQSDIEREIRQKKAQIDLKLKRLKKLKESIISDNSIDNKVKAKAVISEICDTNSIDLTGAETSRETELYNLAMDLKEMVIVTEPPMSFSLDGSHISSIHAGGSVNSGGSAGSREERVEYKTLPTFEGDVARYEIFKGAFQERMRNVSDVTASQWLSSALVMKDRSLQRVLEGVSYEQQWALLDKRFSSEVLATKRALKCFLVSGRKQLKYGSELAEFYLEIMTARTYVERVEDLKEAMLVLLISELCNGFLPDKVAERIREEIAVMDKADSEKLYEIIEKYSKMEKPQQVSVPRPMVNVVSGNGGGGNGGGKRRRDGEHVSCGFCNGRHVTYSCAKYTALGAGERLDLVNRKRMCHACLSTKHQVQGHDRPWECRLSGCREKHHNSLHAALSADQKVLVTYCHQGPTGHLGLQLVEVQGVGGVLLWDGGANCNLVTRSFVEQAGLQTEKCNIEFDFGGASKGTDVCCRIPLVDNKGDVHVIIAAIVDQISATGATGFPADKAACEFGDIVKTKFDNIVNRTIDVLIGVTDIDINPMEVTRRGRAYLCKSLFGTGYFAKGSGSPQTDGRRAMMAAADVYKVKPVYEFLEGEKLGVVAPKRCEKCAGCRDCSFRNESCTWIEQMELEEIEKGLRYLPEKKRWICKYPLFRDVVEMPNNYGLCLRLHHKLVERLQRSGYLQKFDEQFQDAIKRGVFVRLSEEDAKYRGMVNYIPMVEALKEKEGASTPVRICMNSSMKYQGTCLNDVMCKGPSALADQYALLIRFRCHKVGLILDISKFYNSIDSVERDQHIRRVLWSPVVGEAPVTYLTTCVNFGDRAAGCVAITALRKTAGMFGDINPEAARMLREDAYVDDIITGVETKAQGALVDKDIREIGEKGNFVFKPVVLSGDNIAPQTVLGIEWKPKEDVLSILCKVNVSAKRKGARTGCDLDLDLLMENLPETLTMRETFSIIMAQFDPLGLIGPITLQLKLVMRKLAGGGADKMKWDAEIPHEVDRDFKKVLLKLKDAKELSFKRGVVPDNVIGMPSIAIFCDGSQMAYCALAYLRWKTQNGVKVFFLTGKTKVGPMNQITVVRMELNASVLAARLCASIKKAVNFKFEKEYFFTDSSAALGLIKADSGSLATYGGNRVGEIKSLTNFEDWYWVATDQQVADIGTRGNAMPADLKEGTRYQSGPDWLKLEEKEWPARKVVGMLPREELSSAAKRVMYGKLLDPMIDIERYEGFDKAARVLARVMQAVERFKGRKCAGRTITELKEIAINHLFNWHQGVERDELKKGYYKDLVAMEVGVTGFSKEVRVVTMTGRTPEQMRIGYDRDWLFLLSGKNPLAAKVLRDSHIRGHGGIVQTVDRSRSMVWVTGGAGVAKKLVRDCAVCSLNKGKVCEQRMSALPPSRCLPSPPFCHVAIDIFGPITVKCFVKRRTSRKAWGLLFVCQATNAVAMETMESYSMDSFLMSFRRFMARHGAPVSITSDMGTQLTAATKELPKWDWSQVAEEMKGPFNGIEWKLVPVGTPHMNGQAERHIQIAKRLLKDQMAERNMTYGEISTVFDEIVNILNTKPYLTDETDPATGSPLTPQHLLGPRGNLSLPGVTVDENAGISKRFQYVQRVVNDFWGKYRLMVFPLKMKLKKWVTIKDNLREGDVVQILDSNVVSKTWRLAWVMKTLPGEDGLVRRVEVKIAGTSQKNVEVGIQRLRLVYRPVKKEDKD